MEAGAGSGPARGAAFRVCTSSDAQTHGVGRAVGQALGAAVRRDGLPAVIALSGPLGAGKTRFVQGLAEGLGVRGVVRSPTFTLVHEHPGEVPLHHVDLYRLTDADMDGIGLEEVMDAPGVTAIEWPEAAGDVVPAEHLRIELSFGRSECDRCLWVAPRGARYEAVAAAVRACASWR